MEGSGTETDLLGVALAAARAGASVVLRHHEAGARIPYEAKARHDYVTAVDREAEEAIVRRIRESFPEHAILAEEAGGAVEGRGHQWIIDPLDGTTNFIHGFPVFAVSVAAARIEGRGDGPPRPSEIVAGVVVDPLRGESFSATRGGGAFLNGERIRVSEAGDLDACLLSTGFPFRAQQLLPAYLAIFAELHGMTQGIRRPGAAALDLAAVACGRNDGFFEFGLSPWDMAAGALLIEEAGGIAREFRGGDDYLRTGHIVAGSRAVTERILEVIARHYP